MVKLTFLYLSSFALYIHIWLLQAEERRVLRAMSRWPSQTPERKADIGNICMLKFSLLVAEDYCFARSHFET
jgi:hypothetical protein